VLSNTPRDPKFGALTPSETTNTFAAEIAGSVHAGSATASLLLFTVVRTAILVTKWLVPKSTGITGNMQLRPHLSSHDGIMDSRDHACR
jgi:hypothetical protein